MSHITMRLSSDPDIVLLTIFLTIVAAGLFGRFIVVPILDAYARSIGIK